MNKKREKFPNIFQIQIDVKSKHTYLRVQNIKRKNSHFWIVCTIDKSDKSELVIKGFSYFASVMNLSFVAPLNALFTRNCFEHHVVRSTGSQELSKRNEDVQKCYLFNYLLTFL